MWLLASQYVFRSTPLREGRPNFFGWDEFGKAFRSTPLREGRLRHLRNDLGTIMFRSTPLREGRRRAIGRTTRHTIVSIHAPA